MSSKQSLLHLASATAVRLDLMATYEKVDESSPAPTFAGAWNELVTDSNSRATTAATVRSRIEDLVGRQVVAVTATSWPTKLAKPDAAFVTALLHARAAADAVLPLDSNSTRVSTELAETSSYAV